jgi:MFS family permease
VTPAMRGRVMALYSVVFLGSTPIGAPLVGWLAQVGGPRVGMALGGVAALVAAALAALAYEAWARESRSAQSPSAAAGIPI